MKKKELLEEMKSLRKEIKQLKDDQLNQSLKQVKQILEQYGNVSYTYNCSIETNVIHGRTHKFTLIE